jgi:hypothetical protein
MTLKKVCLTLALLCLVPAAALAQVTVSAPATAINITAGDDWATTSFQDAMDMKQNTDLSWHIWSIDLPSNGLTGVAFNQSNANGADLFRATSTTSDPFVELLQSSNRFSAKLGRTGDLYPIDTTKYRLLSYRMCLSGSGLNIATTTTISPASAAFLLWTPNDADQPGLTQAGAMLTYSGCGVYVYDLAALPIATGASWTSIPTVRWLRLDPTALSGVTMDLDWVRITQKTATQQIAWTGGSADIYLDNNTSVTDGNLGVLANQTGAAVRQSSPYTFDPSGLSPGTYFVLVCTTGTTPSTANCRHSPGSYVVNGIPTVTVTAPSPEGSSDDFATVQLNNAWDFDALTDIDFQQNNASLTIDPAFPVQGPDGTNLGNVRVLKGTPTAAASGDAYFYNLFFAGTGRGVTKKIDANRYRILTIDMGLPGPRDIFGGSISRVVWKSTSETAGNGMAENVSQDILINHRAGVNILDRISVDMKKLPLETDASAEAPAGSHGTAGWTGQIENFRFDPHEFTPVTPYWVKQIKLAAFETIGSTNTYTIKWTASDPFNSGNASAATVSAYYETLTIAGTPSGTRTLISTCENVPASSGQCTWNTGNVATASYFVYLSITDGVNANGAHSAYPIQVDPAATLKPRMVLDRSLLNFGGHNNNGTSVTVTPPQQVRLSIVGSGTVNWTATTAGSTAHLFTVSPASGTGPAILTVSVPPNTALPNNLVGNLGTVVVTSSDADNSPQSLTVHLAMTATTGNPFGGFDTPTEGDTIQGSIAVTGWVLDDIGVTKVEVLRDAHPSDPPGAVFNGKVFIGNATQVDGSRTDIVTLFPNGPANYNAGWGYLMLTRGLIWDGKGPFNLYAQATDVEGHVVLLGSKRVTVDNSANNPNAQKPFGAIDTPDQGGTASGGYPNTGWVLSPGTPGSPTGIPIPASGVQVAVDGMFLPNTFSMSPRADITGGFPTFDTATAGRGSFIDTTQFADGVHTIGWIVTDNLGRADGIGSRFFKTTNSSLIATTAEARTVASGPSFVFARLGESAPASGPGRREVRIAEMERLALTVGDTAKDATYSAYRVVDGQLRLLPVGSTFDTRKGAFYWQPAPGFIGDYDFLFLKNGDGPGATPVSVRVTVGPTTAALRAGIFRPILTLTERPE